VTEADPSAPYWKLKPKNAEKNCVTFPGTRVTGVPIFNSIGQRSTSKTSENDARLTQPQAWVRVVCTSLRVASNRLYGNSMPGFPLVALHYDSADGFKHVCTGAATPLLVLYITSPFQLKRNGRLMSTDNIQQRDRNLSHCPQLPTGCIVNQSAKPLASAVRENNEKVV